MCMYTKNKNKTITNMEPDTHRFHESINTDPGVLLVTHPRNNLPEPLRAHNFRVNLAHTIYTDPNHCLYLWRTRNAESLAGFNKI